MSGGERTRFRQLALHLTLADHCSFGNYCEGPNRAAVHAVRAQAAGGGARTCYLCGPAGVGRTHLLQSSCREVDDRGGRPVYLPLRELAATGPGVLHGLEDLDQVCVDDVQLIAGDPEWERALFTLCNDLRERGGQLLAAADGPPAGIGLRLPDLSSRLAWGPVFRLQPLDDEELLCALQLRARYRGLVLSDDAGRYLLRRQPRDPDTLFRLLDGLDRAALAAKRRLTIPFLREMLGN
ncbi:MAG TPA: DnaA regulatory inactivator Hda [Gammaproteobacteria bacterium]|nr:DnaA regulatory inactivator Hda [Gammaproteobacteria bacterium]